MLPPCRPLRPPRFRDTAAYHPLCPSRVPVMTYRAPINDILLTLSAIEALDAHGSAELKKIYLEKLVSGEWTGTMQLTEPQAGSDVGALRTRAERAADGSYRIKGTKIFITYGDHDMTDNIVHFVLARLPDAPAGARGISLFL